MRSATRATALCLVALAAAAHSAARVRADPRPAGAGVTALATVGTTVVDMDRSLDFYTRILNFEKVGDVEVLGEGYERLQGVFGLRMRVVRLRLGDEVLELTQYLAPEGRPIPQDARSNDRSFQHVAIIVSDMAAAYRRLRENRVRHASTGPQRLPGWNPDAGGIEAFYFKDPDGHVLEILAFPAGKGLAKWQARDRLFLGIDHTAVVVSDTEASLRLYRDTLGLKVVGGATNYGTEQEHLNNVFGARLRITALRGPSGPGVEFLEYLAPGDGRPAPADIHANDVAHWQTTFVTDNLVAAAGALFAARAAFVSPGAVVLGDDALGFGKGLMVRDGDGHALRLVETNAKTAAGGMR